MIRCGWCHAETTPGRCSRCGRDPALAWRQRGIEPPAVSAADRNARRLTAATAALRAEGLEPTAERLAERLEVDARTVRRWRAMSG